MTDLSQSRAAEPGERDLLARLRARDVNALGLLIDMHGRRLTRAAFLFLGGDGHAAEDAVQDALIAAWSGARRTGDETNLRAWLFGILFNTCRKRLRKLGSLRRWEEAAASRHPEAVPGDSRSSTLERIEVVHTALARLDEDARAIVILRYERGLSVADTAEALGIPEGTVKSRTHAALEDLRRVLGSAEFGVRPAE